MPAHQALGAASWTARSYLGLPGLVPGAPADAVVYDEDP
jgi:imidazolonepropionase-like amidohydrolase